MLKAVTTTVAMALLVTSVAGCSWFGRDNPEYFDTAESKPLEIPEGLDTPDASTALTILGRPAREPAPAELEPRPPRVIAATGGDPDQQSQIGWTAEGPYLFVEDTPESVARRMRFAIARTGMTLAETDPAGAHRFEYYHQPIDERGFFESMMFWRDDIPNYSGSYRLRLVPQEENTRMFIEHADGGAVDPAAAEHILVIFGERLG